MAATTQPDSPPVDIGDSVELQYQNRTEDGTVTEINRETGEVTVSVIRVDPAQFETPVGEPPTREMCSQKTVELTVTEENIQKLPDDILSALDQLKN